MKILRFIFLFLVSTSMTSAQQHVIATYSIVGWDSATGDLGIAVQSKFLGVGAVVPYAKAGVGALATQAWANTNYGPEGLQLMGQGLIPQIVIDALVKADSNATLRQIGMVDAQGNSFAYTGSGCQQYAGHITGRGYSVQGNILAGEGVIKAMARTFEFANGSLAERLLSALEAGEYAGGDKRGRQSAALLVVRDKGGYAGFNDRFIDIRVDDNAMPLIELRRLYKLWEQTFLLDAQMRSVDMFNNKRNYAAARQVTQEVVNTVNALLKEKPDDPEVLNSLAWTLATNGIDNVRALDLAKRASKLAPNNLKFMDTLAECHFRLGHYDEAIAIETQLTVKDPSNDNYWKQLQRFRDAKVKEGR